MGSQVQGDTIESLIRERRRTQAEAKELQEQIDRLRQEKEKAAGDTASDTAALTDLDMQIEELTQEKREKAHKLKNICRMARTISAGD